MNTVRKLERVVDEAAPEKEVATPEKEKQPLYVVDKQAPEKGVATPKKEKQPFYADISFWIRVAMAMLLVLVALYYFSLE